MQKNLLKHLRNMMFSLPVVFAVALFVPSALQNVHAEEATETHECVWSEEYTVVPATEEADGVKYYRCTVEGCEAKSEETVIPKIASQELSYTNKVYTGSSVKAPELIVKDANGDIIDDAHYEVGGVSSVTKVNRYKLTITYSGDYSGEETLYFNIVPKKPTNLKVSLKDLTKVGGHDDVTVSWTKSTGATGYLVYYKKASASKWTGPKTTTKTSYTIDLANGTKYQFKVVAYYKESGKTAKYYLAEQYAGLKSITTKEPGRIVTKKNQKYYEFYKGSYSAGKYAKKKFITLNKKTYYFDAKGKMVTGWAKISSKYYYFDRSTGVQKKSGTVDGIKISNGKASATKLNKNKMDLMITARKKMQEITKPTDSKSQKLRKVFDWVLKHPYKRYRRLHEAKQSKGWEVTFANDEFKNGKGCCVSEACAFAFLAKECGYTNVSVADDTGHAWAEINGRVYDTLFTEAKPGGYSKYYNSTYKKAGLHRVNVTKL